MLHQQPFGAIWLPESVPTTAPSQWCTCTEHLGTRRLIDLQVYQHTPVGSFSDRGHLFLPFFWSLSRSVPVCQQLGPGPDAQCKVVSKVSTWHSDPWGRQGEASLDEEEGTKWRGLPMWSMSDRIDARACTSSARNRRVNQKNDRFREITTLDADQWQGWDTTWGNTQKWKRQEVSLLHKENWWREVSAYVRLWCSELTGGYRPDYMKYKDTKAKKMSQLTPLRNIWRTGLTVSLNEEKYSGILLCLKW